MGELESIYDLTPPRLVVGTTGMSITLFLFGILGTQSLPITEKASYLLISWSISILLLPFAVGGLRWIRKYRKRGLSVLNSKQVRFSLSLSIPIHFISSLFLSGIVMNYVSIYIPLGISLLAILISLYPVVNLTSSYLKNRVENIQGTDIEKLE